jgi:hypothetical protein
MPRALRMTGLVSLGVFLASVTPVLPAVPPDVLQGWQSYTQRLRHATGTIRSVSAIREGKETSTQTATISFAFGTHGRRVEILVTEKLGTSSKERQLSHRMFCENSQYIFQLNRSNNDWILHKLILVKGSSHEETTPTIRDRLASILSHVYLLVAIEGEFLTHMADHLQCQGDDRTVVSLAKEYRTTLHQKPWTFRSLSLHLNTDEYHTVRSANGEIRVNKADGTLAITNEYQVVSGLPVPLRSMKQEVYRSGDWSMEINSTYEFQVDPSIDPPEREFTLSAFGLPEPPGVTWVQERRTPVYVWLLVAAGVLLTLALVFRWLARRLRRGHSEG